MLLMDITGLELSPNHNHIIDPEPKDSVTFAQYMTVHRGHNTSYKVVSLPAPVSGSGRYDWPGNVSCAPDTRYFVTTSLPRTIRRSKAFSFFVELQSRACRGYREYREYRDRSACSPALVPLIQFPTMPARAPV